MLSRVMPDAIAWLKAAACLVVWLSPLQVKQNEALLIPSGWFYASVAPQDCISVCCFFWHPYALGDIARTQHLQVCDWDWAWGLGVGAER